jgi:hypothetical protein
MEEHREEHASDQHDDPFGRGHDLSLANAPTVALVGAQAFSRKEGNPPRWIPFFLTAALVDPTS